MKFTLVPEYRFETFDRVTPEFLKSIGIKGVLLDVDNTLEPYEHSTPGEHVIAWLDELNNAGIKTAVVSNNNQRRFDIFSENLNIIGYTRAGKPFPKKLRLAMKDIGTDESNTIFIGDQILTDVWAAHNAGIPAILVPPINDKKDAFTRFKRLLERPILKKFERKKGNIK